MIIKIYSLAYNITSTSLMTLNINLKENRTVMLLPRERETERERCFITITIVISSVYIKIRCLGFADSFGETQTIPVAS